MRLNEDLKLRQIGPYYMIVKTSGKRTDMTDVFSLNETAAWLWKRAEGSDFTAADLAQWLCDEYDVTMEVALRDVRKMLLEWQEGGLISED